MLQYDKRIRHILSSIFSISHPRPLPLPARLALIARWMKNAFPLAAPRPPLAEVAAPPRPDRDATVLAHVFPRPLRLADPASISSRTSLSLAS